MLQEGVPSMRRFPQSDFAEPHGIGCAKAIPAVALRQTTTRGGARHAVRRKNPTRAIPKSLGVLTELVQTGL
jgi:hypothetical protein